MPDACNACNVSLFSVYNTSWKLLEAVRCTHGIYPHLMERAKQLQVGDRLTVYVQRDARERARIYHLERVALESVLDIKGVRLCNKVNVTAGSYISMSQLRCA